MLGGHTRANAISNPATGFAKTPKRSDRFRQMNVDRANLRMTAERFSALIENRAKESAFQKLFADCPQILSDALPLRLEPREIRPLGRPGRSEPDFIAFPESPKALGGHSVIELKRPDTRILTQTRKGVVILTRDADTAVKQATKYSRDFDQLARPIESSMLALGNANMIFLIMGLSGELSEKLGADLVQREMRDLLPGNCHLIPYDVLYKSFEASLPPRVLVLVPAWQHERPRDGIYQMLTQIYLMRNWTGTEEAIEFWNNFELESAAISSSTSYSPSPPMRQEFMDEVSKTRRWDSMPWDFHDAVEPLLRFAAEGFLSDRKPEAATLVTDFLIASDQLRMEKSNVLFNSRSGNVLAEAVSYGRRYPDLGWKPSRSDEAIEHLVATGFLSAIQGAYSRGSGLSSSASFLIHPLAYEWARRTRGI
jgi:hypothetical protein